MDQARIEKAVALQSSGRADLAMHEFHSMAEESGDVNLKAALLLNEVKCHSLLGRLNDAESILKQIRETPPDDNVIRLDVDYAAACIATQARRCETALVRDE